MVYQGTWGYPLEFKIMLDGFEECLAAPHESDLVVGLEDEVK